MSDSLQALFRSLTESLESASAVLTENAEQFLPPPDGISALDLKNDLLLSYLQNLAFLILFKIKNSTSSPSAKDNGIYTSVVEKLVELRVYLERGIRPLEQRLKYTIDQYLQAAQHRKHTDTKRRTSTGHVRDPDASDASDSEASDIDGLAPGIPDEEIHAPRLLGLGPTPTTTTTNDQHKSTSSATKTNTAATGIYRPPRHNPTAMPTTASNDPDTRSSSGPRQRKSHLLNEYINEELSSTPTFQPSIGSNNTINARGHGLSTRDLANQRERTEYEETNFTRLPGESKKEKQAKKRREGRDGSRRDMFGGEDWTGLGGLGDRIGRSVEGRRGEKEGVLKRREKRRATEDAPRGDGMGGHGIGEGFEKRRRVLQGRAERKGAGKRR